MGFLVPVSKEKAMKNILLALLLSMGMLAAKEQKIYFAAGCFWGVEKHFEALPGVLKAVSGYAGGDYPDPTYKKVLAHRLDDHGKNYAETVEVSYDDAKISTRRLLEEFWQLHDPTQHNRQGNDYGNNYRSAIFTTTPEQMKLALKTKEEYQKLLNAKGYGKIVTQIEPLRRFYPAEAYHQDYLKRHPHGYCPNHATGVKFPHAEKKRLSASSKTTIRPLGGKEILVIDADGCPYCELFEKNVIRAYHGAIPLRRAHADRIEGFKLKTPLYATPTILFIVDGKEVAAHQGYLSPKEFYKALGAFVLGKGSEAYNVAFAQGTDGRFCKQYKIFKNVGDGVFVDKLSGDALFDTRDRFNSHSGWLSFYRPVPGSVTQRPDNRFGMHRTEVLAKKSGIHLGHVFGDAPGGRMRYCINATVLRFIPRAEYEKIHKAASSSKEK